MKLQHKSFHKSLIKIGLFLTFILSNISQLEAQLAYYNFEGNVLDTSGNKLDGTNSGASLTVDRFGNSNGAYYLDGSNDHIQLPHNSFDGDEYTIIVWYKLLKTIKAGFSKRTILFHGNDYENYTQLSYGLLSTGQLTYSDLFNKVTPESNLTATSTSAGTQDIWYQLVLTKASDGTKKIYIDGVEDSSFDTYNTFFDVSTYGTMPIYIGLDPLSSTYLEFIIDEIGFYSTAVNDANISTLYKTDGRDFTSFEFTTGSGQIGSAAINDDKQTIDIEMSSGSDLTSLISDFTVSSGASVKVSGNTQTSSSSKNDFSDSSNPVIYTVTSAYGATTDWIVNVTLVSDETDFTAFSFSEQTKAATIDAVNHTIAIEVANGTDLENLIATFSLSSGALAKTGGITQISGTTSNDFKDDVTYKVRAEDEATSEDWLVTVTEAQFDATDIIAFSFDEQTEAATINTENHTIAIEVAYGTDLTNLKATFTLLSEASAKTGGITQTSGTTSNDFTNDVTYNIAIEDGTGTNQDWIVSVTLAPSNETDITAFSFSEQTGSATIDAANQTIVIEVSNDANIENLTATFTLSNGASASVETTTQISGTTPNDFTNDVTYNIAIEDGTGTNQDWIVSVSIIALSTESEFISYSLSDSNGQMFDGDISTLNHTINVQVDSEIDLTQLTATFSLSDGATAQISETDQVSGETSINFSNSVTYIITAEDENTIQNWLVSVTVALPNGTDFTNFSLKDSNDETFEGDIDSDNHTIILEVNSDIDLTELIATFSLSEGASAQVSGTDQISSETKNDFSNALTFTVTAEDESTVQDWQVSVTIAVSNETDIISFSLDEQTGPATIDATNHTVAIEVAQGTSLENLVATFSLSDGATAQVATQDQESGTTSNNFENEVTYTVMAEDGSTNQNWLISVTRMLSDEIDIIAFDFEDLDSQTFEGIVNNSDHTVIIDISIDLDLTDLVATFALSDGASAQVSEEDQTSGDTENDFTNDVTYTITAEDGETTQDWVISVNQTLVENETNPPIISFTDLPTIFGLNGSVSFLGEVTDASAISSVVLHSKKLSEQGELTTSTLMLDENNSFSIFLDMDNFDEVGYTFKVIATDEHGNSNQPDLTTIYTDYTDTEIDNIVGLNKGTSSVDYSIVAFPFETQLVTKTLSSLGEASASDWRLLRYNTTASTYEEYPSDFSSTTPGKGYWFLSNNSTEIDVSGGTAVEVSDTNFELEVQAGWNMVGNPFMFDIDWSQVSTDITAITYASGSYSTTRQQINKYEGFFINVATRETLQIPASAKASSSRVQNRTTQAQGSIDSDTWTIPLQLYNDKMKYEVAGVGMHPDALNDHDTKDWGNLPRMSEYLDITFDGIRTRDIVSSDDFYSWTFTTNSSQTGAHLLRWDNSNLTNIEYNLILVDINESKIIDMSQTDSYQFDQGQQKEFRLYYGKSDRVLDQIELKQSYVGQVYPNPSYGSFTLPVAIQDYQDKTIFLNVKDLAGKRLSQVRLDINSTYQELKLENEQLGINKSGIYFLELTIDTKNHKEYFRTKIIVVN